MKLIALDLLKEELDEKQSWGVPSGCGTAQRIDLLQEAIKELDNIEYKSDCSNCKYDIPQEELRGLSDEDALEMFNRCSNCSNYYETLFESK